jgi:hypothetical protein
LSWIPKYSSNVLEQKGAWFKRLFATCPLKRLSEIRVANMVSGNIHSSLSKSCNKTRNMIAFDNQTALLLCNKGRREAKGADAGDLCGDV